ncbi:SpoIIE family protein phosphatase [Blastococcus sp. CT_GayMR16]|uniref:SpoIIE family protein phosphatase n=1 Tax=Blastococcus sp. CT_GayMR16 TaxID=2559607 RepID=UPI0010744C5A|nr:SpoIIE family protein phosphatase [Blastococcus sp. CT_GayMR16]TFV85640.1 STAS domain-containing protein [Blastococcus sp. CT_GayMR16]
MSTTPGSEPSLPGPAGDAAAAALVTAMESAPAAIYCLTSAAEPVWANARARQLGTDRSGFPFVDGRSVAEVVDDVLRTGRPETLCGPLGEPGTSATVIARPMRVAGGPGVLLVLEPDDTATDMSLWPKQPVDLVEQAQLSLLPPSLPMLPDLRLSGSYHRASSARAAGGDWYDAVPLGAGRVALVVGDAVGHGVPAAGAMSRLRGAMRSTALRDPSPRVVLAALDDFAAQMDDVEGASVFYGVLDAGTGTLTYGAAGHPPPLVVHADGRTSFLPGTPRPPLGSLPGVKTEISEHVLEQGATLVLFSNGAIAGGAAVPDEALSRLADVSRSVLRAPGALEADASAGLASSVAEGVRRPQGWPDDVAVLVAHRRETALEPLQLELTAVPSALPGVRRRLGGWLAALGMGEQDRVGVMVAVGEACANAAEHAYQGSEPGPMWVTASVDVDGVLTVTVRDEGTWRPPDRDPGDRGRGLLIMRQLVDTVVFEEEERGTTVTLSVRLRRTPDVDPDHSANHASATVSVDRDGPRPVVSVAGAVDEISAEQMRIRLLEASHGGTGRVELDLGAVTLFSSAAVRVVLAIARIGRDEGWRLVVHAPEGGVTRHILQISGLGGLVDLR